MKIKKGDKVMVMKGKDRGTSTTVIKAMPKENKIVCEGVNIKTFNKKPRTKNEKGTQERVEAPIDVSNVVLVDKNVTKPKPAAKKAVKSVKAKSKK